MKNGSWLLLCLAVLLHFTAAQLQEGDQEVLAKICQTWSDLPPSWVPKDIPNACQWQGITCSPTNTSVVDITLVGISGPLFEDLGNLTSLESFQCRFCNFKRTPIPSSFANLTNLAVLATPSGNITGPLPDLSGLQNLIVLDLGHNFLSEQFPMWIFGMKSLTYIFLHDNGLTGTFPDGLNFVNGDELVEFAVSKNKLQGVTPTGIIMGPKVTTFYVNDNAFDCLDNSKETFNFADKCATIKCQYSNLPPCTQWISPVDQTILQTVIGLWTQNCLPANWRGANTSLACEIPLTGVQCNNFHIYKIHLTGPYVTDCPFGPLAHDIFDLPYLSELTLSRVGVSGSLPSDLTKTKLTILNLPSNSLSGSFPVIGSNMDTLTLNNNGFSGFIPSNAFASSKLSFIEVTNNSLHGDLSPFKSFSKIPSHFDFTSNYFNGSLDNIDYSKFSQCPCTFSLTDNVLTGTIPKSLMSIGHLNLYLGRNRLTGTIPFEVAPADAPPARLYLNDNYLTGSIQYQAYWPYDTVLDNNQLTGSLPDSYFPWDEKYGSFSVLSTFSIKNNNISGTFPVSFENNTQIQTIHLDNNTLLQGTFPLDLIASDPSIFVLTFENTSLSCPQEWEQWATGKTTSCTFQSPSPPPPPVPTPDPNGSSSSGDGVSPSYYVAISISFVIIILSIGICVASLVYFWTKSRSQLYEPVNQLS